MIGTRLCPARSGSIFRRSWIPCRQSASRIPSGRATLITYTDQYENAPSRKTKRRNDPTKTPSDAVGADRVQPDSTRTSSAANDKRLERAFRYAHTKPPPEERWVKGTPKKRSHLVQRVRHAIQIGDFEEFVAAYRALPDDEPPARQFVGNMGKCLTRVVMNLESRPQDASLALAFAQDVAAKMQAGKWTTEHDMAVAVLTTYVRTGNLDRALSFWQWLEAQPDPALTWNSYATAMQLYKARGEPLAALLELYEKALVRLPGQYLAYNLSPGAVLPDREAAIEFKAPYSLLAELAGAYLRSGLTRNAYLILDTTFRLNPTTKTNFEVADLESSRPLSELHTLMSGRARAQMGTSIFRATPMMSLMDVPIKIMPTKAYFATLRLSLAAIYGEKVNTSRHLGNAFTTWIKFLKSMMYLTPLTSATGADRAECARALFSLAKKLISTMEIRGEQPRMAFFNAMLSSFAQFDDSGETLSYITNRVPNHPSADKPMANRSLQLSLITLYGKLHKAEQIEAAWSSLITTLETNKEAPTVQDFRVLIIASNRAQCAKFAQIQFEQYEGVFGEQARDSLAAMFHHNPEANPIPREKPSDDPATLAEIMSGVKALSKDVDIMHREIQKRAEDPTYEGLQFPATIFPPEGALRLSEAEWRALYDEFTTVPEVQSSDTASDFHSDASPTSGAEQLGSISNSDNQASSSSPSPSSSSPSTTSSSPPPEIPSSSTPKAPAAIDPITGTSYGSLRYTSWREFNHLLQLADRHDNLPTKLAPNPGDPTYMQKRLTEIHLDDFTRFEPLTLSSVAERMANPPVEAEPRSGTELDAARAEIRRLRTLVEVDV